MGLGTGGRSHMKENFRGHNWSSSSSFQGWKRSDLLGREAIVLPNSDVPPDS